MPEDKPKRVISDIRPPARKATQPTPQREVEQAPVAAEETEQPKRGRGKKALIITLLILLAVAIWLVYISYSG